MGQKTFLGHAIRKETHVKDLKIKTDFFIMKPFPLGREVEVFYIEERKIVEFRLKAIDFTILRDSTEDTEVAEIEGVVGQKQEHNPYGLN